MIEEGVNSKGDEAGSVLIPPGSMLSGNLSADAGFHNNGPPGTPGRHPDVLYLNGMRLEPDFILGRPGEKAGGSSFNSRDVFL